MAHDYSYAVLRPVYHSMFYKAGRVKIGDNVFLGMRSLILMNTIIGDNVVVGAGAVVSGNIPSNVVVAGNPARIVCTLEEYYKKCSGRLEDSAWIEYQGQKKFKQRELTERNFGWLNQLWECESKEEIYRSLKVDGDDKEEIVADMMKIPAKYASMKEFLDSYERSHKQEC